MDFLEKDLEDIIYEAPNPELRERGLIIYGLKRRQVRIGNYGICDLLVHAREEDLVDSPVIFTIFELKKDCIGQSTFFQALKYARGLQSYLINTRGFFNFKIRITLVGRTIDLDTSFPYLPMIFEDVRLFTYSYSYSGIQFTEGAYYKLIEEGFYGRQR